MFSGPQQIYEAIQLDGVTNKWKEEDYITVFQPLQQLGYRWDPTDCKLRQPGPFSIVSDTPWIHVKSTISKHCALDHQVIYNTWRIIHPRCLECWKVCVTPRTFHELMQLEELERKLDFSSKCGIEMRDYTPKLYGGYFYTNSIDEGRIRYKEVREAIDEAISPDVGVILKRGCTEYELTSGPSPFWHITKKDEKLLDEVEALVEQQRPNMPQHKMIQTNVRFRWLLWAHAHGDMTYLPYNNDKVLFPPPVTFHEGDLDDVKHDLALARGQARGGVDPETSDEFLHFVQDFANDHGTTMNSLTHTLGSHFKNPINLQQIRKLEEVSEAAKNDSDELT